MAKVGRPKAIENPDKLWEYFNDYVKATKANPFYVHDFVGKDGEEVKRKKERPLTIDGFEVYLFKQGVISDLGDYLKDKDGRYTEFAPIVRTIKQLIRSEQIEGGMTGIYNQTLTARLNSLVEKTDVTSDGDKIGFKVTIK